MNKEKRKWCYTQQPTVFEVGGCTKCKGTNITWSEYKGHCWCYDCEIDYIPDFNGVFDGPIPIQTAQLLGLSFDIINLETKEVLKFSMDENSEYTKLMNGE